MQVGRMLAPAEESSGLGSGPGKDGPDGGKIVVSGSKRVRNQQTRRSTAEGLNTTEVCNL